VPQFSDVFEHLVSGAYDGGEKRSLSEIARATGISRAYLQQVRRGEVANPGANVLYQLARYFAVDPGVLIRAIVEADAPLPGRQPTRESNDSAVDDITLK